MQEMIHVAEISLFHFVSLPPYCIGSSVAPFRAIAACKAALATGDAFGIVAEALRETD